MLQAVPLFRSFLGGSVIATNCTCVLQVPALSPCSRDEVMVHVFCKVDAADSGVQGRPEQTVLGNV